MNDRYARLAMVAAATLAFVACASGPESRVSKKGEIEREMEQQAMGKQFIEAIGIGAAEPSMTNQTQRMATSRNAAVVAAQHELLTLVKGTRVQGGITVEKAVETDSMLQTSLDAEIKGAEIVQTEWTKDDGCIVTLRLPKKRLEKILGVRFE